MITEGINKVNFFAVYKVLETLCGFRWTLYSKPRKYS